MSGSSSGEKRTPFFMDDPGKVRGEFGRIGRRLSAEHLLVANAGNLSVRAGDGFFITRTGSYLDDPGDPVYLPFDGPADPAASREYRVHREIYLHTPYGAVVHAHPPHAVALSFSEDRLRPADAEGILLCPVLPIVTGGPGSGDLARNVSRSLASSCVVIARGHGTFAAGATLDEAYIHTSVAEQSCRILILAGGARPGEGGSPQAPPGRGEFIPEQREI